MRLWMIVPGRVRCDVRIASEADISDSERNVGEWPKSRHRGVLSANDPYSESPSS